MTDDLRERLVQAALEARDKAYAPYSGFAVGAALLCHSGEIIAGCNVENGSYGLTVCAERVAAYRAISRGLQTFTAIAVATGGGASPCGACRQVLAEFCDDLPVLLIDAQSGMLDRETSLNHLLPDRFVRDDATG
ncbi:MAG: cytidine deaminase [Planctomycetota bacterium]|nr:MAG: cytidine deaminase [Planctomycetota bacterium]REK26173.1 MAG: cytidine deaminase [Planctomycetota bacterium]REK27102.1 MAG: cytidine deaminase [Planctomycetota bacterium]